MTILAGAGGSGAGSRRIRGPLSAVTDLRFAGALLFAGAAALVAVNYGGVAVTVKAAGGAVDSALSGSWHGVAKWVEPQVGISPLLGPSVSAPPVSAPGPTWSGALPESGTGGPVVVGGVVSTASATAPGPQAPVTASASGSTAKGATSSSGTAAKAPSAHGTTSASSGTTTVPSHSGTTTSKHAKPAPAPKAGTDQTTSGSTAPKPATKPAHTAPTDTKPAPSTAH